MAPDVNISPSYLVREYKKGLTTNDKQLINPINQKSYRPEFNVDNCSLV